MAVVSMNFLLEAGVHFGHQTKRWNPKMKEYIFTAREDIYIIDLQKTVEKIEEAYAALHTIAENGGSFLFVGTKKQAGDASREEAIRSGSFYVTERWLGGTLTNFRTIRKRIKRLEEIEKMEENGTFDSLPKKEVIGLKKEYDKLNRLLCGIREMTRLPQAIIVVDPKKEMNAIREARRLNIPVFGMVDTNSDPDDVDYVIPSNDDAVRSVKLVLGILANAICEVKGLEMLDFLSEEDKKGKVKETDMDELLKSDDAPTKKFDEEARMLIKKNKDNKKVSKEIVEEKIEVKQEVQPKVSKEVKEEPKLDLSDKTLTELKAIAKEKGIKGYSTMKKEELINNLK